MKPPETPVFFVDRSLGKRVIAESLRAAGARVEIHDDYFAPDAPDEDWLGEVGKRGWVVLTKDKRIQHRILEQAAVANSKVRLFALTAGNLQGPEMAGIFVAALPRMTRLVRGNPAPFIAKVTRSGAVSMLLTAKMLKRWAKRSGS